MLKKGILFFGFSELAIGTVTLGAISASLINHISAKPANVLAFVVVSGAVSAALGAGVLMRRPYARKLLMFFAGWIILSKILIFGRIITLNGALETTMPADLKNIISIAYHLLVIFCFHQPLVKTEFER